MKTYYITIAIVIVAFAWKGCESKKKHFPKKSPSQYDCIKGIEKVLPPGWTYSITNAKGQMGHPYGLEEPLFRMDFLKPDTIIMRKFSGDKRINYNPYLRLHFHNIAEKSHIVRASGRGSSPSHDIPLYFSETRNYIIITSLPWINHGVDTEEAKKHYHRLEQALKGYFQQI